MSQENVEIVRRTYAAFERGDLEAALEDADPNLITYREEPEARTWHGREGFLESLADWTEGFDEFSATPEDFLDAGDRVIVRVHQSAVGRSSGAPVEADFWFVHTLGDGSITRLDIFASKAQALEAARLRG